MPDPSLYNLPEQQQPVDQPPDPPIQKIIGDALGALGNALHQPELAAKGAAAHVLSAEATGPLAGIQPPERIAQINRLWAEGRHPADIFDELLKTSWNGGEVPFTKGIADIVYDPLLYLGSGLPAKAAAAFPVGSSMANAFEFLNKADQAVAAAPWNLTKGVVGGTGKVLGSIPLPDVMRITTEGGARVPAETLGKYLGSDSATTLYKQKVRDLVDTVSSVLQRGHSFEQDAFEEAALKEMASQRTPQTLERALPVIAGETSKLFNEVRQVQNATARPQAMAVYEHVQQTVDGLLKQVSANQVQGNLPKEALPFLDQARRAIVAGRVLVDRINQNPERYLSGVTDETGAYNAFDAAMNRIFPVFREIGTERMVPGRPGGAVLGPAAPGVPGLSNWEIAQKATQNIQGVIDRYWNDVGSIGATREAPTYLPQLTSNGPVLTAATSPVPLAKAARDAILSPHADLMAMAEARQGGLPALSAVIPERLKPTAVQVLPEITHQYGQLMADRANIGKALIEAWTKARPGEAFPVQLPARWNNIENTDLLNTIVNPVLQKLGKPAADSVVGIRDALLPWISPRTANGLKNAIARWPEGDMLQHDPYLLTIDRLSRDYAKQYGVGDKGLMGNFKDATALWKELQLGGNPGYLVTNLMGIFANGAFEGISPLRVANHFLNNMGTILKGKRPINDDLKNIQAATNIFLPHSITSGAAILADANATKEFLGRGVTASARVGPLKMALGGAALGAVAGGLKPETYTPENRGRDIAVGAATGATVGATFPALSEILLRRIAAGMEATAREDAFTHQFVKGIGQRLPDLNAIIDNLPMNWQPMLSQARSSGMGVGKLAAQGNAAPVANATVRTLSGFTPKGGPVGLQSIKDFVAQRGGLVSPEWLQESLQKAGVAESEAAKVGDAWRAMLDGASKEGETLAGRIHVDYEKLNNFEQFMATMAPFSTWANKMTPFYAEHVLTKPAVLFSLMDYARLSEEERQRQGLPNRFIGSVEEPMLNSVASAVLGRPIRLFWNPIRGFMPFADVGRLGSAAPNEDNAFASAYKLMTSLGPQPHPLIELGMRMGGAFGPGEPAPPLFSFGNRVLAGTGIDLNLPAERGEQTLRRAISGRTPSDMDTFAIDRKVQELALRNIGHLPRQGDPASDPFMAARTSQAGPIWDQATKEYREEQALRSAFSLGGQTFSPQATLNPEEATIRAARRTPDQGGTRLAIDPQKYPFLNDKIDNLLAQGKGQEPMPRELAYPIKQLAVQAFGQPDQWTEQFGPLGGQLKQYYDMGTVASLNTLYDTITRAQLFSNPTMQGYAGGMSPEETQLQAMLAQWNNPGSMPQFKAMSPDAQAALTKAWWTYENAGPAIGARLLADKSASGYWLQQAKNARDSYRSANPMLDQYINYHEANPGGSVQDFLDHYWNKGVTGRNTQ